MVYQPNGVIMQYFHWYLPPDGKLWQEVTARAKDLANIGITALWLPPAYKASGGGYDVGYGAYDLFDLGEFDQKGTIRTKYGTKSEYLTAIKTAQQTGLQVYADVVVNHKNGGDEAETVDAIPVAHDNRNHTMGEHRQISTYTKFNFPGRGNKYSDFKWNWQHFDAVNHNAFDWNDHSIYRLKDKHFQTDVDPRHGNYDFLMACDLDMSNPEVREELTHWGEWYLNTTGVNGFRLDAIKHISFLFFKGWLDKMRANTGKDLFTVGEYWADDINALHWYIKNTEGKMSLFDVPLHYNFHRASRQGESYDLRQILDNTLMQQQPSLAVTFVENHDSQPLQALESPVEDWFKPLAYAFILLRQEGYPCVFYPDYFGAHYKDKGRDGNEHEIWLNSHHWIIDKLLYARRNYAYGAQYNYFDHPNTIGWTRLGDAEHPQAMAVLISNSWGGSKWMEVGKPNTAFYDVTEHLEHTVTTNEHGWGEFSCNGGSVSVWVEASNK
ncbi:Alpha-amylase [Hyella patelloides LEGE 07179]|uniref:Alpha-amylase n=1 Tax=Hyella patelloides LEGE 07179 TaxID=945734 RepID=A0A563VTK9_9CYAN|nr:alpha-amylase [Hyella patelloides]VEP14601.1 Alpha-amylase [Hyella patelloides LEGE 07179]